MTESRPLIGVPTQTLHAIDGIPTGLPQSWVMNQRYVKALSSVGGAPILLPLLDSEGEALQAITDRLDGLFLAGGVDVDPDSYGHTRHHLCGRTDPARDAVEIRLARWAMAEGVPVLGVCRGMQILNVAAGGLLLQDCGDCFEGAIKHDYYPTAGYARDFLAHGVRIEKGSRLGRLFDAGEAEVNSMHHQGIERLGEGLVATAWSPDGLIEAVEAPGESFVVGVQWHPEMLIETHAGTRRLFRAFVEAASERRQLAGMLR